MGILILFSLIFWALFEQAGSSLNILTDRGVDRVIFGWEVPASMFQSLNAGFIFTIAPLFALLWIALAKRNMEPSTPIKFAIGIVFVGFGFLALGSSNRGILDNTNISVAYPRRALLVSCWTFIRYQIITSENCWFYDGNVVFCFCSWKLCSWINC